MTACRTTSIAFAALLAAAPALAADPPGAWTPPTLKEQKLTLAEAVRITLENDPNLKISEQRAIAQRGSFQLQSGQFDPLLTGNGSYTFTQTALTFSQIQAEEKNRKYADEDVTSQQTKVDRFQGDVTELQRLQADPTYITTSQDLIFVSLTVKNYNSQIASEPDPVKRAKLIEERNLYIQSQLIQFGSDLKGAQNGLAKAQDARAKLGDVPQIVQDQELTLGLDLSFPYRSGVTLGVFGDASYSATGYKGRKKQTELGGLGVEDLYKYDIGFEVNASLLRGRGAEATAAFETSARIDWEASRLAFEHQAGQSVLTAVSAYWNLAGAQELLEITRRSAALHGRRLDVTRALIQADEIPRAELSRELASQATDEALVKSAERSVGEARLALAQAMGIQVTSDAEAPLAADPLPDAADRAALDALAPDPLIRMALDRRLDRQATAKLRESGGVLVRQAETALRPQLDFSGKISAGTVAETSLAKTATGWAAPSFSVSLAFEKPIGNNQARGRLLQLQADLAERSITAADLDRNIRTNVVQVLAVLRASGDQLARVKDAVGLYGKTIDAETERFRAGQSSLLDAIITQDLQTNALFTYTVARQQYATLLARLRYETGTLVLREGERNVIRPGDLVSLPAAAK